MRIVDIQEAKASIASDIRNAYIDFSAMDVSVVKITTDVVRDGAPVVGYGFNSNGRYSQSGILRDRILPRLHQAVPEALIDSDRRVRSTDNALRMVYGTSERSCPTSACQCIWR